MWIIVLSKTQVSSGFGVFSAPFGGHKCSSSKSQVPSALDHLTNTHTQASPSPSPAVANCSLLQSSGSREVQTGAVTHRNQAW